MTKPKPTFLTIALSVGLIALLVLCMVVAVLNQAAQVASNPQDNGCDATLATPQATSTPSSLRTTATATPDADENLCYPASEDGAAVVNWAKQMADALYVNPACGKQRGGSCNDTWYSNAFPQPVIAYGQAWCTKHGDCGDWANGSYQCVSFVRGAYSQVFPMKYTNDAFGLWATYQEAPGWQEIPAAAVPDPDQRGLPEPGDVMVFRDLGVGHVAIVIAVKVPQGQQSGWIEFANANSSSAYDRMPLLPNLMVDTSEWDPSGEHYIVWGYLRPKPVASTHVQRVNQLDPAEYASQAEYSTWASSACSAAAMTEVLNAYGEQKRITNILAIEASRKDIDPLLGLTHDGGIADTMTQFGFSTVWGDHWSLAQVLAAANSGTPVIVGWPPDRYAGGHIVVVTGGDSTTVELVDSSSWDRHNVSVNQFLAWWEGFAAVSTPAATP